MSEEIKIDYVEFLTRQAGPLIYTEQQIMAPARLVAATNNGRNPDPAIKGVGRQGVT